MAISEIYPPDDTFAGGVRIGSRELRVLWSQIATGNLDQKISKAIDLLQEAVDELQVRDDLPIDDPDRTIDPATPSYFWERRQGTWYVVSRVAEITGIVYTGVDWDGDSDKPILSIEQRRLY